MRALPKQSVAYVAVGTTAAAMHFLVLWLMVHFIRLSPAWANVIAFWFAFCVSYSGHRGLTFGASRSPVRRSAPRWMLVSIGGFLVNQGMYVALLHLFPVVHYLALLFIVTAIVTAVTYLLGKYWAFTAISLS